MGAVGGVSKADLSEQLAGKFRTDAQNVVLFGFKTKFGGGRSTGFCLVYDNLDSLKKFEPVYRMRRTKLVADKDTSKTRKIMKEIKIKRKKLRGKAKANVSSGQK